MMNSGFDKFSNWTGIWSGKNCVQVTAADPVVESPTQLIVSPLLRNTFVRLDQTWSWHDEPQEGSFLVGFDRRTGTTSVHWIDSWHNGTRVMPLVGGFDARGALVAHGHFPVEASPDWGWRIEMFEEADRLRIDMFCVNPANGGDEGWVWSEYDR